MLDQMMHRVFRGADVIDIDKAYIVMRIAAHQHEGKTIDLQPFDNGIFDHAGGDDHAIDMPAPDDPLVHALVADVAIRAFDEQGQQIIGLVARLDCSLHKMQEKRIGEHRSDRPGNQQSDDPGAAGGQAARRGIRDGSCAPR